MTNIALIGFGEVGVTLADDLLARGASVVAWDVKFADESSKPSTAARLRPVDRAGASVEAVRDASVVISAVTAAQTLNAAVEAAGGLAKGAVFLDLNSASPEAKRAAAAQIDAAGAAYVEAAVMAPIAPRRIATEMLLGGPHAEAALEQLKALGFAGARFFSERYGEAAAAKLCRSIMVKGVEALLTECLITARHYGVEQTVLGSLSNLLPAPDWPGLAQYMVSRALEHGARRAEEMREAARTVADAGLSPVMSEAIAARQDWAGAHSAALANESLDSMLDAVRAASLKAQA